MSTVLQQHVRRHAHRGIDAKGPQMRNPSPLGDQQFGKCVFVLSILKPSMHIYPLPYSYPHGASAYSMLHQCCCASDSSPAASLLT